MKLLAYTTPLLLATPILACLQIQGVIYQSITNGPSLPGNIDVWDNGGVVCSAYNKLYDGSAGGWRQDQDGHYSLNCVKNHIYAVTKNGNTAWYRNPVQAWQLAQTSNWSEGAHIFSGHYFGC